LPRHVAARATPQARRGRDADVQGGNDTRGARRVKRGAGIASADRPPLLAPYFFTALEK
jgi:hypothetical protein